MTRQRSRRPRSWWASALVMAATLALLIAACGPEDTRQRDGGLGGSSRPDARPTGTSAPELITRPTSNIPYASDAPLPTLAPLPTAPAGAPATPGFGVPTGTAPSSLPVAPGGTPGGSPTRAGSPAATPTR